VYIVTILVLLRLLVALPTLPGAGGLPWAEGTAAGDALRVLVLVFALAFMVYSGVVIASWNAVAFWNSPLVPVLFVGFSFLGGMAALPIIALAVEGLEAMDELGTVAWPLVVALLLGNALVLGLYLHGMSTATRPARVSVRLLLRGSARARFVGGVLGVGLALPTLLVGLQVAGALGTGTAAALVLVVAVAAIEVGGYLLRDTILRAGVYGPPV
jgi:polysulfide reductase chain C